MLYGLPIGNLNSPVFANFYAMLKALSDNHFNYLHLPTEKSYL